MVGLWAIASAVVVPFSLYRQGYSFTVGYGFSVMAMAFVLVKVFGMSPLLAAALFYGFRLGSFLWLRELLVPSKAQQMKAFDRTSRLQRIPFGIAVSFFYAVLMTPALYAVRDRPRWLAASIATKTATTILIHMLRNVGTALAWTGAILEAIADGHKFVSKQTHQRNSIGSSDIKSNNNSSNDDSDVDQIKHFSGPTTGVYRISRHANYTGELVFWLGLLIAGIPSFGTSPVAWGGSLLGYYGIYGIMTNAATRLDKKQKEVYGGQELYDTWRALVKAPIIPFVHAE